MEVQTLTCKEGFFIKVSDLSKYLAESMENFEDDKSKALLLALILKLLKL